jgi:hypothetical protein
MFKPVRVIATIMLVASIVLVFIFAFVVHSDVRVICYLYFWVTDSVISLAAAGPLS